MTENTLSPELAAQVAEAMEPTAPAVRPKTKPVTWNGRTWQVRAKPGAVFLAEYEAGHLMGAAKAIIGPEQYDALLELDPDIEGDDGMDGLFKACNKAWGLAEGN
jgi:hypothetical protein